MAQLELKIGDKTYNKARVDNLSSTSQISSDAASVNYGVIPSTGNATMRDNGGHIKNDIENGVLPVSNAPTKVIINGNQIQEHTTSDSDYNIIDKELSLQFSDRLSLLDKVTYAGMPLREYSMTAYEILDNVIGSYGDYCKACVVNWIKYQNATAISTRGGDYNSITVNTVSGWEIIGTPIKVVPNKQYNLAYSIKTDTEYTTIKGDGIPLQVLNSVPTNSDCTSIELAHAYMSKTTGVNVGTITFTPTTDVVYIVLNFGYASDNISGISLVINSLSLNGNSLSISTANSNNYIRRKLDGIKIEYPYLPSASYRETIEKFCVLAQCSCALDEDGRLNFYNLSPTLVDSDTTITVSNPYKISNLNKTLFLKNKIDGVDIKQNKVVIEQIAGGSVYNGEYTVPDSTREATGGVNNSIFTADSSLGCAFNTIDRGQSGLDSYQVYAGIDSSWGIYKISVPKRSSNNLEQVLSVWTGVDSNKKPYITYSTTYELTKQNFSFRTNKNATSTPTNFEWTGYPSTSSHNEELHKISHSASNPSHTSLTCTISITDEQKISGMSAIETDDNYILEVCLQQNTKWYDAYSNWSSSLDYCVGNGTLYSAEVSAITITINGVKKVISFEEVDCSSNGIESAVTPVSIPTSELMQNLSDVRTIRNNILADYHNGIQTASIDLFCGLGDWENGEILQPNNVIQLENENGKWRVTGRTFNYKGAPTLSLELQKQNEKTWHDVYTMGRVFSATPADHLGEIDISSKVFLPYPTMFKVTVTFGIQKDGSDMSDKTDDVWFDVPGRNSITASVYYVGLSKVTCHLSYDQENGIILYDAPKETRSISIGSNKGDWVAYTKKIDITVQQYY